MGLRHVEAGKLGHAKAKEAIQKHIKKRRELAELKILGKLCLQCQRQIPFEKRRNRFCSHSCFATYNNTRRAVPHICLTCGARYTPKNQNSHYCSSQCSNDARYPNYIKKWLAGEISGGSWNGISVHVRKWLIKKFGEQCSICGWAEHNPTSNKVPIQVDHIDGNPENHRPENLRFLCPNCHSLTPTFGGLNRGKGRKQRYAAKAQR